MRIWPRVPGPGAGLSCRCAAFGQSVEGRAESGRFPIRGQLCPALSFRYAFASIVWLPWHMGSPRLTTMFWKGVLTFFFQDGLKHKQSPWWASGLRGPTGSIRCLSFPRRRLGPRAGWATGMDVSEERSGRPASTLFIWRGPDSHIHPVTVAREAPVFLHRKFTARRWRAWHRASSSPPCF